MEIIKGTHRLEKALSRSVVTIGNFDGVHIGHKSLLDEVLLKAKELDCCSVVMSFRPHPVKVLFPEREVPRIFDFEDQENVLERMGIDFFVQQPFSRELSRLSAERFLTEIVLKPLHPLAIVVGYDFAFGSNREGSLEFLHDFGKRMGIQIIVKPPIRYIDKIVSSTLIRQKIEEGNMKFVGQALDRPFFLDGVVERGAGRGRQIGFPTANVFTKSEIFPRIGVYLTTTVVGSKSYPSITNVGKNPTFEEENRRPVQVESHILNFDADIYGDSIKVEFLDYIRAEKKFNSIENLVEQIAADVKTAKDMHAKMGGS
ncbi:MAG: bifunctional riboflavin kinase/FAD synthetase [Bdellovibrionales bacterium]